jgi:hypothetical protein
MEVSAFCTATWQITPSAMACKPKIWLDPESKQRPLPLQRLSSKYSHNYKNNPTVRKSGHTVSDLVR